MIINGVPTKIQIYGGGKMLPLARKYLERLIVERQYYKIEIMDRRYIVPLSDGDVNIYIQSTDFGNLIRIDASNPYPLLILLYPVNTTSQGQEHTLSFNHTDGGDYRILMYDFLNNSGFRDELKSYDFTYSNFKKFTVTDNGLNLVIQVAPKKITAVMGNVFALNNSINYDADSEVSWAAALTYTSGTRYVGAKIGYRPDYGTLKSTGYSRQDYKRAVTTDGYTATVVVAAYNFSHVASQQGHAMIYDALAITGNDTFLYKRTLTYADALANTITTSKSYQDSTEGEGEKPGYTWTRYNIIAGLDKDIRLLKKTTNTLSGPGTYPVDITLTFTQTTPAYKDPGHTAGTTYIDKYEQTYHPLKTDLTATRTESLMIGDTEIDTVTYTEHKKKHGSFTWIYFTSGTHTVVQQGDGYYDTGGRVHGVITGDDDFALTVGTQIGSTNNESTCPAEVGSDDLFEKSGNRSLSVYMYDNYDGSNNFIIIYGSSNITYKKHIYYDNQTTCPVTQTAESRYHEEIKPLTTTTSNRMAYRLSGGTINYKTLPNNISAVSCQIFDKSIAKTKSYMSYTYTANTSAGAFSYRVIGVINMESGDSKEWQINDDDSRLSGFNHFNNAAIGIISKEMLKGEAE